MSMLLLSPVKTRRVTVLFGGAWVPAAGSVLPTSPSLPPSTLVLFTVNPASCNSRCALVGVLADDVRHGDRGLLLPDEHSHGGAGGHVLARGRCRGEDLADL